MIMHQHLLQTLLILSKPFQFTVTVIEESTCMNHKLSSINIIKIFIPVKLTLLFSYICNLLSYCQLINKKGNSFTNKQNTFLEYRHEYVVFRSEIFTAYGINIDIFARKYIHVCICCTTCTLRIIFLIFFFYEDALPISGIKISCSVPV